MELPRINDLVTQYSEFGARAVAVNCYGDEVTANNWLTGLPWTLPAIMDISQPFIYDSYTGGGIAVPQTYIIGGGRIRKDIPGAVSEDFLRAELLEVIFMPSPFLPPVKPMDSLEQG